MITKQPGRQFIDTDYRSYLLRLWRSSDDGRSVWRASLEHALTHERHAFANPEALLAYLLKEELGMSLTAIPFGKGIGTLKDEALRNRHDRPRALVIDDDQDTITLVAAVLVSNGFDVYPARGGSEGLLRLEEVRPHVVVLDVMLPGLSGWDVLRRLRIRSDVPVVMLTGLADAGDRRQARALGAVDYVTKPFGFDDLVARIKAAATDSSYWSRAAK